MRTVLGAGHWGTALALYLARRGEPVILWGRSLPAQGVPYFDNTPVPKNLLLRANLAEAVVDAAELVVAVPSHGVRGLLRLVQDLVSPPFPPLILASKGFEKESGARLDEVIQEQWRGPWAILSGPSFASDLAAGRPLAMTLASLDKDLLADRAEAWRSPQMRIYPSQDVVGVCLAGAIKNVLAIAAGISDGLGNGDSARAALIVRGLAELQRLGTALGGSSQTFMGLAGAGDLILTTSSDLSRNRRFGLGIGAGREPGQVLAELGEEVEGWRSSYALYHLAQNLRIEMPIAREVYQVLYEGKSPQAATLALMQRGLAEES